MEINYRNYGINNVNNRGGGETYTPFIWAYHKKNDPPLIKEAPYPDQPLTETEKTVIIKKKNLEIKTSPQPEPNTKKN